jgi:hypothetical protein
MKIPTTSILLAALSGSASAEDSNKVVLIKEAMEVTDLRGDVQKLRTAIVSIERKELVRRAGAHIGDPEMNDLIDRNQAAKERVRLMKEANHSSEPTPGSVMSAAAQPARQP